MRIRKILKSFWITITEDGGVPIAIMGSFVTKITLVGCALYGTLLISENYSKSGETDPEKAKDLLSLLFFIENCMSVPLSLIFGYLGDKIKVWKALAVNLFLGCLVGFTFIYFAEENGIALSISFVGFILSAHIIQMQVSFYKFSNPNFNSV